MRAFIKISRDQDRYVEWSTVVDAPTFVGTREQIRQQMIHEIPPGYDPKPGNAPEDRLQRCDETGTTALWYDTGPQLGAFDDNGMVVEGRAWLPRERLGAYCDALERNDTAAAEALLTETDG